MADVLVAEMHERGLHPRLKDTYELRERFDGSHRSSGWDGDLSKAEMRVLDLLPEDLGVQGESARSQAQGGAWWSQSFGGGQ